MLCGSYLAYYTLTSFDPAMLSVEEATPVLNMNPQPPTRPSPFQSWKQGPLEITGFTNVTKMLKTVLDFLHSYHTKALPNTAALLRDIQNQGVLPHPRLLNGWETIEEYEEWKIKMSQKLTSMGGGFRSPAEETASMPEILQICYIASRTTHAAFDAIKDGLPGTDGDGDLWEGIRDVFNVLHRMYEDRRASTT